MVARRVVTAQTAKNGRARTSAFPPITTARQASERYNLFTAQALKAFQGAVKGVANFQIDEDKDYGSAMKYQIGKVRPMARAKRSTLTTELADTYHQGSVWYHDAGPHRPSGPDYQGNVAIRRIFCGTGGYGYRYGCSDMTTDTLIEHIEEHMAEVRKHFPGLNVFIYKSDFAAEVASQGHGDTPNVAKIQAMERRNPGLRFVTYGANSQHNNKADGNTKSLNQNIFAIALRSGLGEGALPALEMSAIHLHNMQVASQSINPEYRGKTRKQILFGGEQPDASTMIAPAVQMLTSRWPAGAPTRSKSTRYRRYMCAHLERHHAICRSIYGASSS